MKNTFNKVLGVFVVLLTFIVALSWFYVNKGVKSPDNTRAINASGLESITCSDYIDLSYDRITRIIQNTKRIIEHQMKDGDRINAKKNLLVAKYDISVLIRETEENYKRSGCASLKINLIRDIKENIDLMLPEIN